MDLLLSLDGQQEPLYRLIYGRLRSRIVSGDLEGGKRLPSSRDLAEQLGVSRTVVLLAYEQLEAEGYVVGRSGSGTYVTVGLGGGRLTDWQARASIALSAFGAFVAAKAPKAAPADPGPRKFRYDFAYGKSRVACFPFSTWRRILLRHAPTATLQGLDYGPTEGSTELREAVCAHLRRARGMCCDPCQVIIVNGAQQALDLVVRVLIERGVDVVVEDPCYQGTRELLAAAGARTHSVPVDEDGLITERLPPTARAVFVTPSHQFPTGVVLSSARRQALLAWAARTNAFIVEDDYDGEFRYRGRQLASLQGMDQEGRVIYVGTFSRTIFPALRLGYMLLPRSLLRAFTAAKWLCDRHSSTLEQSALAELITSGLYERHLQRVRRRNAAARAVLLAAVHENLHDCVHVTGDDAGVHVVLWLGCGASEDAAIAAAAARGVRVYGISRFFAATAHRPALLLGYARLSEAQIREGIRQLAAAITPGPQLQQEREAAPPPECAPDSGLSGPRTSP